MVAKQFKKTPDAFFSKTTITGSHDKSIEAVAKKVIDGAAVDSLIYDYLVATNPVYTKLTRVLEKSPPYGIPPVVANKAMDPQLKASIRAAFLAMADDPAGKAILEKIKVDKFIIPRDEDYDSVRDMEKWLASQK
jgi:phosphonate transport system substrate-binding protein